MYIYIFLLLFFLISYQLIELLLLLLLLFILFYFLDFTQKGNKLQYWNYKHIIVNMNVGNYANFIII
jgi:hypothetical protein